MANKDRDRDEADVSLLVYLDERFRSHDQLHQEQAKSVLAAIDVMNERMLAMNALRETVNALANQVVTRDYYEQHHTDVDKRLQMLERQSATKQALESQNQEVQKMRRNLFYTVAGGIILIVVDIALAALHR